MDEPRPGPAPAAPSQVLPVLAQLGVPAGEKSIMQQAFDAGARKFVDEKPELAGAQLPGIVSWAKQRT